MATLFLRLFVLFLPFLSNAQDRILIKGNQAYEVKLVDFYEDKFAFIYASDPLKTSRYIRAAAVEAWFSKNERLIRIVGHNSPELLAKRVDSSVANKWVILQVFRRVEEADTSKLLEILPLVRRKVGMQEEVLAPGLSQAQLYTRAMLWFTGEFNYSCHPVLYASSQEGIIAGKGSFVGGMNNFGTWYKGETRFRVFIRVQEGRVRLTYSEFAFSGNFKDIGSGNRIVDAMMGTEDLSDLARELPKRLMLPYLLKLKKDLDTSLVRFRESIKTDPLSE